MIIKKSPLLIGLLTIALLVGCSNQQAKQTASTKKATTVKQQTPTKLQPKVSLEKARELFKQQYPNADISELQLKKQLNKTVYHLTGLSDTEELEMQIDSQTGDISHLTKETLDTDEQHGVARQKERFDFKSLMTLEAAQKKAQHYFDGDVLEATLEKDDGVVYWEIEGHQKHQKMQVKIDATTGEVVDTELDD
ncbi:PepSY domain-containing protein [Latilactobacillus sakei]|uniref:PepSY domain-containing protein n=2 Tax=Latilactobacillus sakei TaxID=1599 RepID=UPI0020C75478|nr:PepSY domain-containing protein [Latilactobacillus sakei]MCP8852600.1 PepSY domain-containing protein [Latilactobacillus sakei]